MSGAEFSGGGEGSWTYTRDSDGAVARAAEAYTVAWSILYHPDWSRIGEVSRLRNVSGRQLISRTAPLFEAPNRPEQSRALLDRGCSRQPHELALLPDGAIRITPPPGRRAFEVNGVSLPPNGSVYSSDSVRRGLLVVIADRVVLLLHHLPPERPPTPSFGLIGQSPSLQRVREEIQRLCHSSTHVLLRGESGTGKELVARALHDSSDRRNGPFRAINLATVPPQLVASTLFGHVAGAFTGAQQAQEGIVLQAQGGTLLLDEIGETSPEVQVSLLRFLETKQVEPVGSAQSFTVDVRILAATDADLEQEVVKGRFRAALLHRLESYCINVPALCERRDDIGRLLLYFLQRELEGDETPLSGSQREEHREPWLPASVVAAMAAYSWPGNVRELRNSVRQLVIWNRGRSDFEVPQGMRWYPMTAPEPGAEAFPARPRRSSEASESPAGQPSPSLPENVASQAVTARTAELDAHRIEVTLERLGWRIGPAAKVLGVSRNTLLAHIDRMPNLHRPKDYDASSLRAALERHGGDHTKVAAELRISLRGLKLRMTELGLNH